MVNRQQQTVRSNYTLQTIGSNLDKAIYAFFRLGLCHTLVTLMLTRLGKTGRPHSKAACTRVPHHVAT
jgi:hypothetical protein